jgi:hypothetical protein
MDTHFADDHDNIRKFRKLNDESHFSSSSSNRNVFNMAHSSSDGESIRSVEKNDHKTLT